MINGYNPYMYGSGPTVSPDYGYNQPMQGMQQNPQQSPQQKPQAPQFIDGGFVTVQSIDEAKRYPVSRGTCVTFKIEGAPYICTKVMGFSMLDQPIFKKFRLSEENEDGESVEPDAPKYVTQEEHENITDQVKKLGDEYETIESQLKKLADEVGKLKARKRPKIREDEEYDE